MWCMNVCLYVLRNRIVMTYILTYIWLIWMNPRMSHNTYVMITRVLSHNANVVTWVITSIIMTYVIWLILKFIHMSHCVGRSSNNSYEWTWEWDMAHIWIRMRHGTHMNENETMAHIWMRMRHGTHMNENETWHTWMRMRHGTHMNENETWHTFEWEWNMAHI